MRIVGHKPRRFFFALALFVLLLVLAGWFFRPLYTITDLGALPGHDSSRAAAINGRGDVVGDSQSDSAPGAPLSAFVYRDGTVTRLSQSSSLETSASAINDSGQAAGLANAADSARQAAVFSASRLRLLGFPPGYTGSSATGINARGQVVGTLDVLSPEVLDSPYRAFLYSGGRMTVLGLLPGWHASEANGINAAGQVVGDDMRGVFAQQAFLYDSATGKMTALPTPPGMNSLARAVNARGDVIGEIAKPHADGCVALWQNGQVKKLGALPGTERSIGAALNDRGQAAGTAVIPDRPEKQLPRFLSYFQRFIPLPPGPLGTAWVYRDGKMSDLNALIPRGSGWTLETATGINDRGQIVGQGLHGGQERAFLLTPK
jgi:probable HAF family extracellular repeat protein